MTTSNTNEIARLSNITAAERAVELNAPTREWLAEDEGRWACLLVEDQDFWAEQGTVTGLDLERRLLAGEISDLHKEAWGVRPRFFVFENMSLEELRAERDSLISTLEWVREREEAELRWEEEMDLRNPQRPSDEELALQAAEAAEDALWAIQDALEGVRVRA